MTRTQSLSCTTVLLVGILAAISIVGCTQHEDQLREAAQPVVTDPQTTDSESETALSGEREHKQIDFYLCVVITNGN